MVAMITMGILGHKRKSSDKRGSAPGGVVESIEDDQTGTSRIGQYPTGQSARDAPSLFLCLLYLFTVAWNVSSIETTRRTTSSISRISTRIDRTPNQGRKRTSFAAAARRAPHDMIRRHARQTPPSACSRGESARAVCSQASWLGNEVSLLRCVWLRFLATSQPLALLTGTG